jgi:acetoin utilization protein AcuB
MMANQEEWLTTNEASERLGVTTARIRQMVANNQLAGKKMGGKYRGQWLIKASEVDKRVHKKGVTGTMRVRNRMTPNPITANPKTNYNEALRLMQQNNIKSLPILNIRGELIGLVTHKDMLRAEPSPVTSLSVFEIASLLEKVTMDKIMQKPVFVVEETCSITNAANFMLLNEVGCLPVVKDGKLSGIITDTDIFKTFVDITGGGQAGSRIEARMPDQKGQLAPFIEAFSKAGSYIVSVAITYDKDGEHAYVDIKERGGDEALIKTQLDELGNVEIVEFRPSDEDQLLKFG